MIFTKPFFPSAFAALLALLVCGLLVATSLSAGHEVLLPLDDSYIHLQYAWQAAQGHFLQYNTGDAPTTGATSLFYMLLLAAGFALGLSREAMPAVVLLSGGLCFALAAALAADAARRLAASLELEANLAGVLAGLWFAGGGWMAWALLSGMETGWLLLCGAGARGGLAARRPAVSAICAALAALTRPEASGLAAAILVSEMLARTPADPQRKRRMALMGLSLLAVFVSPLVNRLFSGSANATGFLAKSWFTMQPFYLDVTVQRVLATVFELAARLIGGPSSDGHWHTFPLLQCLAVLGVIVARKNELWRVLLSAALWVAGLLVATSTLQTATWHHYRYQMPAYPALVLLGVVGALWLVACFAPKQAWARVVLLAGALAWSVYAVADFSRAYARDVRTTAQMHLTLADWLRTHTPAGARIVVHDVGTLRFLTDRYTIDTVGLTTAGSAQVYRNGPGALYELFERLRPDYYAVYPTVAPPYFGISTAPDLLGTELFRVCVPDYSPYVAATDTQVVTQPDWSGAALAGAPQQPDIVARTATLALVDSVDIADIADEEAHTYAWWNAGHLPGYASDARRMAYRQAPAIALADGGRLFDGGQSFTVAATPGQPLLLVGRFHQMADMVVEMRVNDEPAGDWRLPAIPGEWLESAFSIPAGLIRNPVTRLTFAVKPEAPDVRFSPFYFWAYQGDVPVEVFTPTFELAANFGTVAQLTGYDLPATLFKPGDVLPLTLYWRGLQPQRADWHVFVHLMDPQNDTTAGIKAQWDSAPRSGTYPFWVWQPDEWVAEPSNLYLPPETPPGDYALLVGVYNLATGERALLGQAPDYGANRLQLSRITIQ